MKNWLIIIVGALIFIVLVLVVWQVTYFKTTVKEQVYIVPQGFKGIVLIAYDQKMD